MTSRDERQRAAVRPGGVTKHMRRISIFFARIAGSFCKIAIIVLMVSTPGFASSEAQIDHPKEDIRLMGFPRPPELVWEVSGVTLPLCGYDASSDELVAVGESATDFYFFRQFSSGQRWIQSKRVENYVREQPAGFVPYIDGQLAILTNWIDQYRLLDLNTGDPLTPFFQADFAKRSVSTYVDKPTNELRILALYNGTARLLDEDLNVLWSTVLLEHKKGPSSWVISLNATLAKPLAWITTTVGRLNVSASRISCVELTSGTVLWYRDNLYPRFEERTSKPIFSDLDDNGVPDLLCKPYLNGWTGFTLLDGLDGTVIWQSEKAADWVTVLAAGDISQDETKGLILDLITFIDSDDENIEIHIIKALSIPAAAILWQKKFVLSSPMPMWDFWAHVDEFSLEEPGLEILVWWQNTTTTYEAGEYIEEWQVKISLEGVYSRIPLWNIAFSVGPTPYDDLPDHYYRPLPDINGDGQADFIFGDEQSGRLVRDGATAIVYSKVPLQSSGFGGLIFRDGDKPPIVVCHSGGPPDVCHFYSFNGIKVPKKETEASSSHLGTSLALLWTLIAVVIMAGPITRRKIRINRRPTKITEL